MTSTTYQKTNFIEIITGESTRWDAVNIAYGRRLNDGQLRYPITLLVPKSDIDTVYSIEAAMKTIHVNHPELFMDEFGQTIPFMAVPSLLKDGDLHPYHLPEYRDCWYIPASNKRPPYVIDEYGCTVSPKAIHDGDYGRALISVYATNFNGNPGFWARIEGLQFLERGEQLGNFAPPVVFPINEKPVAED